MRPRIAPAILLLLCACDPAPPPPNPGGAPQATGGAATPPAVTRTPERAVDGQTAIQAVARAEGGCAFLAPASWSAQAGPNASGIDLADPTRTQFVSYVVYPVNTMMAPYAGAYGPPMNDPDMYSTDPQRVVRALLRYAVGQHGGAPDLDYGAEAPEAADPYTIATLRGSTHSAVAIYAAVPGADPQGYVLPVRVAIMANRHWPERAGALAHLAMEVRCATRLQLPRDDVRARVAGGSRRRKGEGDEAGYNRWRGSEWVHDPSTGENFSVTGSNWSNTGPDGPGYYKVNGNDWTKLTPGRSP